MIPTSDNGTILKCRTLPFHGNFPIFATLGVIGLILWTLLILVFGRNFEALIFILLSWAMTGTMGLIIFALTKYGLINYSKRVIKQIVQDNKSSC